jgi:hypothetical protein
MLSASPFVFSLCFWVALALGLPAWVSSLVFSSFFFQPGEKRKMGRILSNSAHR